MSFLNSFALGIGYLVLALIVVLVAWHAIAAGSSLSFRLKKRWAKQNARATEILSKDIDIGYEAAMVLLQET